VVPSLGHALTCQDLLEGELVEDVQEEFIAEFRDITKLNQL